MSWNKNVVSTSKATIHYENIHWCFLYFVRLNLVSLDGNSYPTAQFSKYRFTICLLTLSVPDEGHFRNE